MLRDSSGRFVKGNKLDENIKHKISESLKKNHVRYWQGKKRSIETIEKIRIAKTGKKTLVLVGVTCLARQQARTSVVKGLSRGRKESNMTYADAKKQTLERMEIVREALTHERKKTASEWAKWLRRFVHIGSPSPTRARESGTRASTSSGRPARPPVSKLSGWKVT